MALLRKVHCFMHRGIHYHNSGIHMNSARHESWRRATTAILLGIAFQDLIFTKHEDASQSAKVLVHHMQLFQQRY